MDKRFSVMVVGDNPDKLMEKYDLNLTVKEYVKYKYSDAKKMKENYILWLEEIVNNKSLNLSELQLDLLNDKIKNLKNTKPIDFYSDLTNGMKYDANGNALSSENPNGKWRSKFIGDKYSLPLILKDGNITHQSIMSDIDWVKTNVTNDANIYKLTWELIVDNRKPISDIDKRIYNNMKDKLDYLLQFENVDNYISYNCSYWNYAFLDENGWIDLDDENNQIKWVINYFDRFVSNLEGSNLITIYEYMLK